MTSEAPFFGAELLQIPGIESLERNYKRGAPSEPTLFIKSWAKDSYPVLGMVYGQDRCFRVVNVCSKRKLRIIVPSFRQIT